MAKQRRSPSFSRSGLPLVCGETLPDGRECLNRTLGPCDEHHRPRPVRSVLGPHDLLHRYTEWFAQDHPLADPPPAMGRFVAAWKRDQASGRPTMPPVIGSAGLRYLYLGWRQCQEKGGVFPYDLAQFVNYWETETTKGVE